MSNTATYHFNPFSLVTRVNDEIMINTSPSNRVVFPVPHLPIINYLIDNGELKEEEVLKLIAPTRLNELLARKVLLKGAPHPISGRYSRQRGYFSMISDQPDALQQTLRNAHALILGVGAIGSHTCWNLAAIGVGKITLVDFDTVEESNFNRQLMYTPSDLGKFKVDVLSERIRAFNPEIEIVGLNRRISSEADVEELIAGVDIVLKAIDTPEESMEWVNTVCVRHAVPYICGGFLDSTAVVGPNYIPGKSSCFACTGDTAGEVRRLHGTGPTFGPLATLVTSMLSMLAFRILTGKADGYVNRVYMYNTDNGSWDNQVITPTRECKVCGTTPPAPVGRPAPNSHAIGIFRAMMMALLTLTVVLGEIYKQPLVGVLMFVFTFATIPVVTRLCDDNPLRTRREFFVLASIYIGFSLAGLLIRTLYAETFAWPHSLSEGFDAMQAMNGLIIQAALGITVMFFLLCMVKEAVPKVVRFLNQDL